MKLGTKVFLVIVIVGSFMLAVTYLGSLRILESSYVHIENQRTIDNLKRGYDAIQGQINENKDILLDWAVWDDMYKFAVDQNKTFLNSELTLGALKNTPDLDILLLYNTDGKPVYTTVVSPYRTQFLPTPPELTSDNPKSKAILSTLLNLSDTKSLVKGVIDTSQGLVFISSHSILTSDGLGPSHGILIIGRYFTPSRLEAIQKSIKLDMEVFPLSAIIWDKDLQKIYKTLVASKRPVIQSLDETNYGYRLIRDINNKPVAILRIFMLRTVHAVGVATIHYFEIAFILSALAFALLLFYLLRILVINRLEKINDKIVEIGESKNFALRVPAEGSDELSSVGSETNRMLDTIQAYNEQKQTLLNQITYELDRVNTFSKKLQETETLLNDIINSMPSILAITDKKLKITNLNYLAETETGLTTEQAKGHLLFDLFPYLKSYEDKIKNSILHKNTQLIDKIVYTNAETRYFTAILYPLSQTGNQSLAVRIDDISDRVKLEERVMQNDKLASIGVLTAGIAHEINNPINFVSSAITPLKNDIQDILTLLNKYSEIQSSKDLQEKLNEIAKLKATIDIDYTIQETDQLLEGIKNGANRTATIVKDLKLFSRLDEDTMKKVDIHEGIDSALTLLQHTYKDKIKIIKEYGDIPPIDCYPGKLNQVFMNILSNAIDAIPEQGEIIIQTTQINDHVTISFKDSGVGISEENKSKIFDPFFTTKEVGEGTGLGLSISSSIIQDHNGLIEVKSQLGQGTEIIISLPIDHFEIK